ncbi:MAG: response regulator [Treponema sp.]|jgi:signal transduction histidine kinase/DNA-binding response OmpR family regulator|nr:response regulator [Treponema sp.]
MKRLSTLAYMLFTVLLFLCGCAPEKPGIGKNSFYINLNDFPLYAKTGFDPADIATVPDTADDSWRVKKPGRKEVSTVKALQLLEDVPPRSFLSPFKEKDREYTILIPFTVGAEQFETIRGEKPFQPGVFLASLGNNWEIFFNGRPVKSEIHLDEEGQIKSGRSWRYVAFPLDRSAFVRGTNILAFRIVGEPHSAITGLWYDNPYYISDYDAIRKNHDESLVIAVCAVYCFVGLYHFLLFLSRPKDRYNLYYCFFSILLGIYFLMRSNTIYTVIPNTDITFRLEYASLYTLIFMQAAFLEHLNFGKTKLVNRICGAFCLLCSVAQGIFSNSFGDDVLYVWWAAAIFGIVYIIVYDIGYAFCRDFRALRKTVKKCSLPELLWLSLTGTPLGNIIIGAAIMCVTAVIDIANSIYLNYGVINASRAGLFIFTVATTVILARRFGILFSRLDEMNILLEKSNLNLEATVRERTRELELQTEVAKAASRAKSDFLARMSHEIRTPLNAVLGLSEVELQSGLPGRTRLNLEKIHHSGSHLLEIVNNILDISKIESGNFEIVPAEYEPCGVINDVIQINIVRRGVKPVEFNLEIDESIPSKLYGDELRIKQILNNLLSNAFKYTEKGYVRLLIGWERQEDTALLDFTVEDSGRGIKKEDLERLFSEYTQFERAANRRIEGTGLGLSITKGLVERMTGKISVESEYGKGSVFRVSLPQGIVDEKPIGGEMAGNLRNFRFIEERSRSRGNTLIRSWMPYGKVLVVDDLETNLDVMKGLLMPYGLRVDTAISGKEAIERIRSGSVSYDVVFMDHMMPEMDGIEATRIIRNEIGNPCARQAAIVALTANAVAGNREMFLANGFTDFISKPIDINQLDMVLNRWVRDKQSEAVLKAAEEQDSERAEAGLGRGEADEEGKWLLRHPVEGIDFTAALILYGNSGAAYMPILKSFVAHTPFLLEKMDTHLESSSPDYTVEVHGLKGICNAIGAVVMGEAARELEFASKEGNFDLVRRKHGTLRGGTLELTERLKTLLEEWDAGRPEQRKERRAEPDRELLGKLSEATAAFNSNETEEVLGNLEQYHYEREEELILWLREQAENFDYDAMHRRLEEFLKGEV